MNNLALEVVGALEVGLVATLIAVIARAHVQEVARESCRCLLGADLDVDGPGARLRGPLGTGHHVFVIDALIDVVFCGGFTQILQDRGTIGDRLCFGPRLEAVAQGVHVAVGTYARITEQVPGAAKVLASFQDREASLGARLLQEVTGADSGDSSAHNQDVYMYCFINHCFTHEQSLCGGLGSPTAVRHGRAQIDRPTALLFRGLR